MNEVKWPESVQPTAGAENDLARRIVQQHYARPSWAFVEDPISGEPAPRTRALRFWLLLDDWAQHARARTKAIHSKRLEHAWREGASMRDLCAHAPLVPPLHLFKFGLARVRELDDAGVRRALRHKTLSDEDRTLMADAEDMDMIVRSATQNAHVRQDAARFEEEVWERVVAQIPDLTRQTEEMQKRDIAAAATSFGPMLQGRSTPDMLLSRPIVIRGHEIHWIDAKATYGVACSRTHQDKCRQQAQRCVRDWGPGAIVFRHGHCQALDVGPSVLVLAFGAAHAPPNAI